MEYSLIMEVPFLTMSLSFFICPENLFQLRRRLYNLRGLSIFDNILKHLKIYKNKQVNVYSFSIGGQQQL